MTTSPGRGKRPVSVLAGCGEGARRGASGDTYPVRNTERAAGWFSGSAEYVRPGSAVIPAARKCAGVHAVLLVPSGRVVVPSVPVTPAPAVAGPLTGGQ